MIIVLEMFFDNEKVFTIFREILKQKEEEICFPKICFNLGVEPDVAADILSDFVFLGILEETEDTWEKGIFKINIFSPIILAICKFDEIVTEYAKQKVVGELLCDDGDVDVDIKDILQILEEENGLKDL